MGSNPYKETVTACEAGLKEASRAVFNKVIDGRSTVSMEVEVLALSYIFRSALSLCYTAGDIVHGGETFSPKSGFHIRLESPSLPEKLRNEFDDPEFKRFNEARLEYMFASVCSEIAEGKRNNESTIWKMIQEHETELKRLLQNADPNTSHQKKLQIFQACKPLSLDQLATYDLSIDLGR